MPVLAGLELSRFSSVVLYVYLSILHIVYKNKFLLCQANGFICHLLCHHEGRNETPSATLSITASLPALLGYVSKFDL